MGLFSQITQNLSTYLNNPQQWFVQMLGGGSGGSGEAVNKQTAPQVAAVYSATKLIADTVATLPFSVLKESDEGRTVQRTNPIHRLMNTRPSVMYNSLDLLRATNLLIDLTGNAYWLPIKKGNQLSELRLLSSDQVSIQQIDGEIIYSITLADQSKLDLSPMQILHFKTYTMDGITGLSPLHYAKESIGTSLAATKNLGRFYGNGAVPMGALAIQSGSRNPEKIRQHGENFVDPIKLGKTPVLTEGAEFKPIALSNRDSQFIETMNFSVEEIARVFMVPVHKLQMFKDAKLGSIEQMQHQFVSDCIRPRVEMIEREIESKLFTDASLHCEFDLSQLMRGDMAAQTQRHVSYFNIGVLSKNDIRKEINLPPVEGGDEYHSPANYQPNGDIENGTKNREPSNTDI
ncbi:MAG: phage portal protein [Phaeodactylibacter sp.]|nr:phage portal protein [Phaeodactylibacter sp.]